MKVRFRNDRGRKKRVRFGWKGRILEKVKEYKYLEYVFRTNGGQEAQKEERVRKAAMVMGQVWSFGKKMFNRDLQRKLWLLDTLV